MPKMKKIIAAAIFILLAFSAIHAHAQKSKLIRVLIVDGYSNHDWKQTTQLTKWILEESGRFEVDVFTVPVDSLLALDWKPEFKKYAVVIQNTNNYGKLHLRWPRHAEQALESYVKGGGGLYIVHSANNSFPHWPEYDKMIGLGWRPQSFGYALEVDSNKNIVRIPPGEGKATRHGKRFNAIIEILNRHPINKGFPDKWQTVNAEVYNFARGTAENVTVLSYAFDSTDTKRMWPVEWVVKYGKGRVYNSSMGHLWPGEVYPAPYRCVGYQTTVIRVTEWLATGKVKYPVPANFPTKDSPSVRSESIFTTAISKD